ncbi:phospho-sugar mutase [Ureibacillus thermosphaericus]|uniref:Phosphoglucomutase n=1 Tax=Ureibacillus thermosphaericus TaxID=51173 RepID=A0A840PKZ7_URETH|nr:phospho-sugar mutase [Ureibacillus thermosphaericus]MBB5149095.1 phosphoglucomutase [Ureibacillus thermosphaericus]NKZ31859.1 phospho-sugar mutase [Ureibacillus thermosphaericus]
MSVIELYQQWKNEDLPNYLKEELEQIAENFAAIEDRFYQYLSFGTAGMRGILGAGTNRMNIYTIRRVAEGLACYIDSQGESAKRRGVVIAYDTRHYSYEFALETARVLGAHGISSYLYKEPRPTPQLSFTVRELHAFAGVVITASHNPKQYNGFKVYGEDGAQLVPSAAKTIVDYMKKIENIFAIEVASEDKLEKQGLLHWILEEYDEKYLANLLTLKNRQDLALGLSIVYTPLHGTGFVPVTKGLEAFGFTNIHVVESQATQDGSFPTVAYPNPEEPAAFKLATELGEKVGADLLLATDPDADRLGVAVWNGEKYEHLTGNQLGALLLQYLLETKKEQGTLPEKGAMVKTIVTSEMGTAIAKKYNVKTFDTLTGFKYIAEKIAEFEKTGEYTFIFGYEESYGYLIKPFARDKDAVQVAIQVAEMAAYYATKGKKLSQVLEELYGEFGYYREALVSKVFEGKDGQEKMKAILDGLRKDLPKEVDGVPIVRVEDYWKGLAYLVDGTTEPLTLPKENVLKFVLADDSWVTIRPSGTEPKCKFYFGVVKESREAAEESLESLVSAWHHYLAR